MTFIKDAFLSIMGQFYISIEGNVAKKDGVTRQSYTNALFEVGLFTVKAGAILLGVPAEELTDMAKETYSKVTAAEPQLLRDTVQRYTAINNKREAFKQKLADLAQCIQEDTGHPLVFLVDELDRCRPTYALEVLERVKHLFDVPNVVFVFGVNRDVLANAVASTYGIEDGWHYLSKFFVSATPLAERSSSDFRLYYFSRLFEAYSGKEAKIPKSLVEGFVAACAIFECFEIGPREQEHVMTVMFELYVLWNNQNSTPAGDIMIDLNHNAAQHVLCGIALLAVLKPMLFQELRTVFHRAPDPNAFTLPLLKVIFKDDHAVVDDDYLKGKMIQIWHAEIFQKWFLNVSDVAHMCWYIRMLHEEFPPEFVSTRSIDVDVSSVALKLRLSTNQDDLRKWILVYTARSSDYLPESFGTDAETWFYQCRATLPKDDETMFPHFNYQLMKLAQLY